MRYSMTVLLTYFLSNTKLRLGLRYVALISNGNPSISRVPCSMRSYFLTSNFTRFIIDQQKLKQSAGAAKWSHQLITPADSLGLLRREFEFFFSLQNVTKVCFSLLIINESFAYSFLGGKTFSNPSYSFKVVPSMFKG